MSDGERSIGSDLFDGSAHAPYSIDVGRPWTGPAQLVAQEGFGWHSDADLLLVVSAHLSDEERAIEGAIDVAVVADGPLVGLLVRPPGWEWLELMAFLTANGTSPQLAESGPHAGERITLSLVIVEQTTRVVTTIRSFTLSPHASRAVRREVAARWTDVLDIPTAGAAMDRWFARHPTSQDSLLDSIARCKSGD